MQIDGKYSRALTEKKEFTHYRKNINLKKGEERIVGRDNWNNFVNDYFAEISRLMNENEAGVLIPRLGYFFNWRLPYKTAYFTGEVGKNRKKEYFNFETNHDMYLPTFFPIGKVFYYCMDKNFSEPHKEELCKKLRGGKRYKMYISTLKRAKKL